MGDGDDVTGFAVDAGNASTGIAGTATGICAGAAVEIVAATTGNADAALSKATNLVVLASLRGQPSELWQAARQISAVKLVRGRRFLVLVPCHDYDVTVLKRNGRD